MQGRERDELVGFTARATATDRLPRHLHCMNMARTQKAVPSTASSGHGIEGLRSSTHTVLPAVTSPNTKAPTIIIAERAPHDPTARGRMDARDRDQPHPTSPAFCGGTKMLCPLCRGGRGPPRSCVRVGACCTPLR